MRDGRIVGIVSRANLVRALGAATGTVAPGTGGDDRTIRDKLLAELRQQDWAKIWPQDVIVSDRIVHLWFASDEPEEKRRAARVAAENVAGVRGVEEHVVPAPLLPVF
jgi:osmotically-inducible protein OsmY